MKRGTYNDKRSLGLSIYPDHSNFEDNAKYLELGHKHGFSRIFMSMLEVQGSPAETQAKYKKIIKYGNKLGYQTFFDVASQLFDKLGIDYSNLSFFAETGAAGIRLDQAFDVQPKQCFPTIHTVWLLN